MEARRRKKSAKRVKSGPSSSSSSCGIANLPDTVLMEILCRVPIKTLMVTKSVCRSWLNLIRDPQFSHLHQSRAPAEVFFQPYHDNKYHTMKLHLGNFHFPNNPFPCHFEFSKYNVGNDQNVSAKLPFSNSCNGLLCYYGWSNVERFALVWNPCTSEFITFPPPKLDKGLPTCRGYGLGFSTKANKFKLLRLMGVGDAKYSPPPGMVVADICTIEKTCTWKRIGPCSSESHPWFRDYLGKIRDLHAVFLKGNLHWVCSGTLRSCIDVHTFDFEDDHFGTLPLPHCLSTTSGNLHTSRVDNLGVLKGCLFIADHRDKSVSIWLMKEYGVEDSWTKLFCLGSTISIDKGLQMKFNHCLPITYMDNGEIVMKCISWMTSTITVYNPVLKSARVMGSCPVSVRVIAYSPSLVMLKNSMLGYDVKDIARYPADGFKLGEMSRAPGWWIPVKKFVEKLGSSSCSSFQRTGSMGHERQQSESSTDSVRGALSPSTEVCPQGQEATEKKGKNKIPDTSESSASEEESSDSAMSESSASGGRVKSISKERERRLGRMNKMSLPRMSLMLEMEKLKQLDKILDQREKLLNILQKLENTDQSRMSPGELDRHLSKIKRYENLVARTFDQ